MRCLQRCAACSRALARQPAAWMQRSGARQPRSRGGLAPPLAAAEQQGAAAPTPRQQHAALQAEFFDREVKALQASITPDVDAKLARIANAIPGLSAGSRVLDAGAGEGALIPHLQARLCCLPAAAAGPAPLRWPAGCDTVCVSPSRPLTCRRRACPCWPVACRCSCLQARGVQDILAVDVSPGMLEALHRRMGPPSSLGNDPAVRTWLGDVADLPSYQASLRWALLRAERPCQTPPAVCLSSLPVTGGAAAQPVCSLPVYNSSMQGPFDVAIFNAVFGNLLDPHDALTRACFLLKPGRHVGVLAGLLG